MNRSKTKESETVSDTQERRILMDWINSVEVKSCMLASSVEDLKRGDVLVDLAAYVTGRPVVSSVRRTSIGAAIQREDCIYNLGLLMREFAPILPPDLRVKPADLIDNEELIFELARFFANFQRGGEAKLQGKSVLRRPFRQMMQLESPGTPGKVPVLNLQLIEKAKPDQQQVRPPSEESKSPGTGRPSPKKNRTGSVTASPRQKPSLISKASNPVTPVHVSRRNLSQATDENAPESIIVHSAQIPPVSQTRKSDLFLWLKSLDILRRSQRIGDVPELCRTGVLLCDLINRLEGKNETIKGVERFPKNKATILANVTKALSFLRVFDKMNSRFLWAMSEIIRGDEEVVWGLIGDVRSLYKTKTVAMDVGRAGSKGRERNRSREGSLGPTGTITSRYGTAPSSPKPPKPLSTIRSLSVDPDFQPSLSQTSVSALPLPSSKDMESQVRTWLSTLKLSHHLGHESKHFLSDPFRNGVLLCDLVMKTERIQGLKCERNPTNIPAARRNVETVLEVLKERRPELPPALLNQGEKIVQGSSKSIWTLLWTLLQIYSRTDFHPSETLPLSVDLPYSDPDLKRLDASLAIWIHEMGLSPGTVYSQSITDLLPHIRTGVLLCDIVSKVINTPIPGVFRTQKTENSSLSNIRKALEPLRIASKMSQEFVWMDREIREGDLTSIYGLLEDLHRYHDNLPLRRSAEIQSPYFGKNRPSARQTPEGFLGPRHKSSLSVESNSGNNPNSDSYLRKFRLNKVDGSIVNGTDSGIDILHTTLPMQMFQTYDGITTRTRSDDPNGWFEPWLDQIGLKYPSPLPLADLRTGVLLCQMLEKLTNSSIPGFSEHPKTTAAALHNIRQALSLLRQRPGFPREFLFVEEDVLKGNHHITFGLFSAIRNAFKTKVKSTRNSLEKTMSRINSDRSFRSRAITALK